MRVETYVTQTRHRHPLHRLNCILSEGKRLVNRISGGWFCDPWQRRLQITNRSQSNSAGWIYMNLCGTVLIVAQHVFIYFNSLYYFFLLLWGGVRLIPRGTSATAGPTVPAPDGRRAWNCLRNKIRHEKPKYSEKTCLSAISSTINPTRPDMGQNPGHVGGRLVVWQAVNSI
jgi:hypothetical protein